MPRASIPTPARIVRKAGVCGGEPTVEKTRIPVRSIVVQWQLAGDLEAVRGAFPQLDLPAIKEALAFYEANRAEIDRLIEESEAFAYSAD